MSVAAESGPDAAGLRVDLRVPHHWQLSEGWGLQAEEIRRICAPVCLKTVLDFKIPQSGETGIPLEAVIERALANGGRTEDGWKHAAEVAALRDFGLNAWRRDWSVSNLRAELSRKREGYLPEQMASVRRQQLAETIVTTPLEKARLSILTSVFEGEPVIASVAPGFSENKGPHQLVIHGYEESADGTNLLITDPILEDRSHQERLVAWDYFAHFFRQRAIFVGDRQL